jgi:hypothetical protein
MTTTNQVYPPPARRSVWTFRQKVIRLIWSTFGRALWISFPRLRPWLIRRFGGGVGPGCRFARSVDIAIPWNLRVGSNVEVGRDVILYALGVITLGAGCRVWPRASVYRSFGDGVELRGNPARPAPADGEAPT